MADRLALQLAYLLPRRLVYWCAIRVGAYAAQGPYSAQDVPSLTFTDALKRWRRAR